MRYRPKRPGSLAAGADALSPPHEAVYWYAVGTRFCGLSRLALRDRIFLLVVHPYREGERRQPDRDYEDVDEDGGAPVYADGSQEGAHVRHEDGASDGRSQDARRQDANHVRRDRRRKDSSDQERPDYRPGNLREIQRPSHLTPKSEPRRIQLCILN